MQGAQVTHDDLVSEERETRVGHSTDEVYAHALVKATNPLSLEDHRNRLEKARVASVAGLRDHLQACAQHLVWVCSNRSKHFRAATAQQNRRGREIVAIMVFRWVRKTRTRKTLKVLIQRKLDNYMKHAK